MLSGSLTSTLRPIRIAFVVPPRDRAAVLKAIRISSFLWGGSYNPIIQLHRRIPAKNPFFQGASNADEVFQGQLKAYDPDFVVRLGSTKNAEVNLGHYTEIEGDKILSDVLDDGTPRYGIGLFEILRHLLKKEFRYVRRDSLTFHIPQVKHSLLWAGVFGDLTPELTPEFEHLMQEFPAYQSIPCQAQDYLDIFHAENLFIRRLSHLNIECRPKRHGNDLIFLMDERSVEDVVFYWNLRALGWNILPVPKSAAGYSSVLDYVSKYVEECYLPYRHNPSMFNYTTLLKAPSITAKELGAFADSLTLKPIEGIHITKLCRQDWIPRIWNEWDRRRNGGERGEITVKKKDVKLFPIENGFDVPSLLPDFAHDYGGHGTPRCANELNPRIYGESGTYAEVIPEGGDKVIRAVDRYSIHELRCSSNGIVFFPTYQGFDRRLELPKAEPIFQAWFNERGWDVQLSDKGHIAKHLLRQVGGIRGSKWLTEEPILLLLHEIASKKWLVDKAFRGLISRHSEQGKLFPQDLVIKWLNDSEIVRLGVELKCPECRQMSWYSVAEADYSLECRQCLTKFLIPSESTTKINWAYRGNGAFSSHRRAHDQRNEICPHCEKSNSTASAPLGTQGGLAVILVFRLFSTGLRDQVTPMLSFIAKKDSKPMEVDLALLTRRIRGGRPEQDILFAECKSYNEFKKADIDRMELFVGSFPGAAMVFATLRRELTKAEVQMLTRAAKRSWKLRAKGVPFSPLVVLTGNELFSSTEPRSTWRNLGGKFARFADLGFHQGEIEAMAEATQQLYLGLDPNQTQLRRQRIK
jgi:hypothetical protein